MINLKSAEAIISLVSFFLAYIAAICPAGAFRAWVAKKMGDDTPEHMGFLTLNPIMHIDPFGLLFLVLFNFGWGRYIPINPFNIHRPRRILKLACAYLSDVIMHLFMALLALIALLSMFGPKVIGVAAPMIRGRILLQSYFAAVYPDSSSLAISIGLILIAYICINVVLTVLNFILNGFGLFILAMSERDSGAWQYNNFLFFAIPMLLILFFADWLNVLVIKTISIVGYLIASLLNLV